MLSFKTIVAFVVATLVVAGVGFGIAASAGALGGGRATGINGRPIEVPTPGSAAFPDATAVPTLTNAEIALIQSLVSSDPHLQAMSGGGTASIISMGVWTERGTRIGGVADVRFSSPRPYSDDLPVIDDSASSVNSPAVRTRGYALATRRINVAAVTEILVLVDFRSQRVVAFSILRGLSPASTPTPVATSSGSR